MFNRRKSGRSYSLTAYTGVQSAPPNAASVSPAALAAASSVAHSRANSMTAELTSSGMCPFFSKFHIHYVNNRCIVG